MITDDKLIELSKIIDSTAENRADVSKMRPEGEIDASQQAIPVLKRIEKNTEMFASLFKKGIPVFHKKAPIVKIDSRRTTFFPVKPIKSSAPAPRPERPPGVAREARIERDKSGRFLSKKERQGSAATGAPGGPQRGKLATIGAFALHMGKEYGKDRKGVLMEAAGRTAMGSLLDSALEMKERFEQAKEATGNIKQKYRDYAGDKGDQKPKEADTKEEKRHNQLLSALKGLGPGSEKKRAIREKIVQRNIAASIPMPATPPPPPPPGGGTDMLSMIKNIGPVLGMVSALPLGAIAAGVTAVGAVGAAGYSAVTGKDNFISKGAQAIGLVPKLETDANGKVVAGAVATASESGKGGAGTISTGKNDAGGASYGKKQLASAGGERSPVAQFVKQSSHAKDFEGLTPGSPEFNKKWKDVAGSDKNFGAEQDGYIAKTMSAPVLAKAAKGGFSSQDVGVREALISQSVNHGPGGNKKILEGAQAALVAKYGSVEAAPVTDQIDSLTASRKQYVNSVADNKVVTAQKLRAKGDEKGALKAEGEARQLKQMAGVGGRYDKESAIEKDLSATGGFIGQGVAKKSTPTDAATIEGSLSREAASTAEITRTADARIATPEEAATIRTARANSLARVRAGLAAAGQGSLAAKPLDAVKGQTVQSEAVAELGNKPATITNQIAPSETSALEVVKTARSEALSRVRARLAEVGQGSLEAKPIEAAKIMAKPLTAERITPEMAAPAPPAPIAAQSFQIPGMDKLVAAMDRMSKEGGKQTGDLGQINTEFDDISLTMMAYDLI
ncbi:MAG: hypothetical protein NTV58_15070 [Deltaproteobacteria bacterium]|nr:hypothetical protein [Deltaproteobacteria bacterium]